MLEANSADEVLKILGETEYANIMGKYKKEQLIMKKF